MLILGIDPGSRHTGLGLVESRGADVSLVFESRLSPSGEHQAQRLADLTRELNSVLDQWHPDAAALESPFFGMNARSLIVLSQARGAILAVLGSRKLEVREYTPAEVKKAVAGNGRAEKAEVQRMVHLLLSLSDSARSNDVTDAIAVALCFARRFKMDRLEARHGLGKAI